MLIHCYLIANKLMTIYIGPVLHYSLLTPTSNFQHLNSKHHSVRSDLTGFATAALNAR